MDLLLEEYREGIGCSIVSTRKSQEIVNLAAWDIIIFGLFKRQKGPKKFPGFYC